MIKTNRESELRFVVLHHDGIPEPHFDLMFETAPGSALSTWRFPTWPPMAKLAVTRLADHRPAYLDYEGEIAGARGRVTRIVAGTCQPIFHSKIKLSLQLHQPNSLLRLRMQHIDAVEWEAIPLP